MHFCLYMCNTVFRMFSCLQIKCQPFYLRQLLKFHPFDWMIEINLQTEVSLKPMPGFPLCLVMTPSYTIKNKAISKAARAVTTATMIDMHEYWHVTVCCYVNRPISGCINLTLILLFKVFINLDLFYRQNLFPKLVIAQDNARFRIENIYSNF